MKTLFLMSIIWATFVIPAIAARRSDPVKGLRWAVVVFAVFLCAYYYYVAYYHTAHYVPLD